MKDLGLEVAKAAITVAMSSSREEEAECIERFRSQGIKSAGVDIGGNLIDSIPKIIERAVVASRRSGITTECFAHDGAVAGAAREAVVQVYPKANGLNVGGKLSIARLGGHLTVCIFVNVGLLHLNEVVVGMGHRSISD
ncbi:HutP [Andreesenia angusta]|uniref:Hut operon positive regulatory protein n=1 Tax=Andreesenia angusta TaxID=39480 RepID=A0A1S1V4P8_9FIRM|nr:HutP family protein [Andreesenia angusta]OHW61602.1 HutP [Andreesenia angusta]